MSNNEDEEQLELGVFQEEEPPVADLDGNDVDEWLENGIMNDEELSQGDSETTEDDEVSLKQLTIAQNNRNNAAPAAPQVEQVSLATVPDNVLTRIMGFVEGLGRLKLLSKAMYKRVHSLLKWKKLTLRITAEASHLTIDERKCVTFPKFAIPAQQKLVKTLRRWSADVFVHRIMVDIQESVDDVFVDAIIALCQFNADQFEVYAKPETWTSDSEQKFSQFYIDLPYLDFSTLLIMAGKIRKVTIDHLCSSLEGVDLAIVWKSIIDSGCKMESFKIRVREGVAKDFVKAAFNVLIIEENGIPRTIEYENLTSKPVKLFASNSSFPETQIHFSEELMVEIVGNCISFEKVNDEEKADSIANLTEINLNHVYVEDPDTNNLKDL